MFLIKNLKYLQLYRTLQSLSSWFRCAVHSLPFWLEQIFNLALCEITQLIYFLKILKSEFNEMELKKNNKI